MLSNRKEEKLQPDDIWEVSHAAGRLSAYGCSLSAQHLADDSTRIQFNRELAYYARRIVMDVEERQISKQEGLQEILIEKENLMRQSTNIFMKTTGLAAGVAQAATGAAICFIAKSRCTTLGMPLMLHGSNNVYENGRSLYEGRDDIQGPVRQAYHRAAESIGLPPAAGNMAYGAADLALSFLAMRRMVLKRDAWRLYRYVSQDYVRAYTRMGRRAIVVEGVLNSITLYQMVMEWLKK